MKKNIFLYILIICISTSCAVKTTQPQFTQIKNKNYPAFHDDMNYDGLIKAIDKSLEYYERFNSDKEFNFGDKTIKKAELEKSLKYLKDFLATNPSKEILSSFFSKNFTLYKPKDNQKKMLFTGYYEPELVGSLTKTDIYKYPLYLMPEDILYVELKKFSDEFKTRRLTARKQGNKIIPYYTNNEIAFQNALKDKAEVLVWLKSPIELFFLQIQGSGKVYLENGDVLRVHYAGANGHAYKSIGRYLINKGKMTKEEMSMQNLKKYLLEHPEEMEEILSYNESYVFFEKVEGGPYGALSKELTSGRSLACDLKIYPRGALVYIKTKKPVVSGTEIKDWIDFGRFMLIQDTGGAIKGHFRGDIFFGCGPYAKTAAGHLAQQGEMYLLLPKIVKENE